MKNGNCSDYLMTFGGHLEVLRQILFRILGVSCVVSILVFCGTI